MAALAEIRSEHKITSSSDALQPAEKNPTFALHQNGDWGLFCGESGMFAVRYVTANKRTNTGHLQDVTGALVMLANHDTPIIFKVKPKVDQIGGRRRLAKHDGVKKGDFDSTIVPLYRRIGEVVVGDYKLSCAKVLTPKGKAIFLKVDTDGPTGKGIISGNTPVNRILKELSRQSQIGSSK
jgi:hypothetical protein